jgi:hypothetical protein
VAVAGALALVTAGPVHAAPAQPSNCVFLAVSDRFATDGTAYCAGLVPRATTLDLWSTHDHARSWTRRPANGLPLTQTSALWQVLVSPEYPTDHALYVGLANGGLYRSVDDGGTFTPAVPFTGHYTLVSATAGLLAGVPLPATPPGVAHSVVYSAAPGLAEGSNHDYVVDPEVVSVRPVPGSPQSDVAFVVPPDAGTTGLTWVVARTGNGTDTAYTIYECTAAATCATARARIGVRRGEAFEALWFAADYARSHAVFLLTLDAARAPRLYRSADGARTFAPVGVVNAAIAAVARSSYPNVGVAPGPPGSRTVFVRVEGWSDQQTLRAWLYRSDDDGVHWRVASWGRVRGFSVAGSLPVGYVSSPYVGVPHVDGLLRYTGDGRLLMSGGSPSGIVAYCSKDGGVHWTAGCR